MRRLRPPASPRALAAWRGITFLYFVLLAIPTFFVAAGFATDFTRIIIANRQVANATQAAALAGAQQYLPDTQGLDANKARAASVETYCVAQRSGETYLSTPASTSTHSCARGNPVSLDVKLPTIIAADGTSLYQTVSVTSHYTVNGLIFVNFFGLSPNTNVLNVTKTASICIPGNTDGPTNGYCTHAIR